MKYQITYRNISNALYHSLSQDPFYIELERSIGGEPGVCTEAMLKYFDYSMKEALKYGELFIPEGKSFGASIWLKPVDNTLAKQISYEKKLFIHQHLGECSLKKYTGIIEFMSESSKGIVPKNSWYLSIVGIAPQYQGQGLGSTLIKAVLEKTDRLGVPSYLETFSPRNISFYERLGYRKAASFVEPVTGSEYWIMLREPFVIAGL